MGRNYSDRVAEYVDSDRMFHWLRLGRVVTCNIQGNYGTYRTSATIKGKWEGDCSCPAEYWPSKHMDALRLTFQMRPRTFVDIDSLVKRRLEKRSQAELVGIIREMVVKAPATLGVLGVKGYEDDSEHDEDVEDQDRGW